MTAPGEGQPGKAHRRSLHTHTKHFSDLKCVHNSDLVEGGGDFSLFCDVGFSFVMSVPEKKEKKKEKKKTTTSTMNTQSPFEVAEWKIEL